MCNSTPSAAIGSPAVTFRCYKNTLVKRGYFLEWNPSANPSGEKRERVYLLQNSTHQLKENYQGSTNTGQLNQSNIDSVDVLGNGSVAHPRGEAPGRAALSAPRPAMPRPGQTPGAVHYQSSLVRCTAHFAQVVLTYPSLCDVKGFCDIVACGRSDYVRRDARKHGPGRDASARKCGRRTPGHFIAESIYYFKMHFNLFLAVALSFNTEDLPFRSHVLGFDSHPFRLSVESYNVQDSSRCFYFPYS